MTSISLTFNGATAFSLPPLPTLDPAQLRAHFFSESASWLVPGRVLIGRYPGSCPSRPCDAATQRNLIAVLREHVDVGVLVRRGAVLPANNARLRQERIWKDLGVI